MARNGSGTYTLPSGNPVVTGATISSTTHNTTMTDIETALTASIAKDGQTVWTGNQDMNGGKIILDADADTSITADTDDQIDIEIAGADDFRFTANTFTALSGSTIAADTIAETTSANGVVIDSVTLKDGNVVLGSGNGIDFSATSDGTGTASSELLDDYEEGTFTPTLQDTSLSDGEGQTYTTQLGFYTKIGNVVEISITLNLSSKGTLTAGNQVRIAGLPYTAENTTDKSGGVYGVAGQGYTITANTSVTGEIVKNTTYIAMGLWDATTGVSALLVSEIALGANIILKGSYYV